VPIYTSEQHQSTMQYVRFIIVNYVSELQLSHAIKHILYYVYYTYQLRYYVI